MSYAEAVAKLKDACDRAYDKNQNSCSNAVWDVIKELVNSGQEFLQANELIDQLSDDWEEVSVDDGFDLANKGVVVVGGLQVNGGHGHVIVIYPGPKIPNGGYQYFYKKMNKYLVLKSSGLYPRALSTSMSRNWPGTLSKGDKTVWDPWADDEKFKQVDFWAPPGCF
ncbi:MAG: hypothetical protein ABSA78_05995 [Candidatus Sulfotelmatobacter sp.]|jgi:hypothetical protein